MVRQVQVIFMMLASAAAFAQDMNPHPLVLDQTVKLLTDDGAKPVKVENSSLCSKIKSDQDERTRLKNLKTSYPVYAFVVQGGDSAVYRLVNRFAERFQRGFSINSDVSAVRYSNRPEVNWEQYAGRFKQQSFQMSRFYYVLVSKSTQQQRALPVRLEFSSWQQVSDGRTTELCLSSWVE